MLIQQAQQQPQVEAPLFGSIFKKRTGGTIHEPITHTTPTKSRTSVLEKLSMGTDIISTLGMTGAQLY
jgi:hypothetical protein